MQVRSRYKWAFILVFITVLMIALAYLVSEKLIRHLDEQNAPVGVFMHPAPRDEIKISDEFCFHLSNHHTLKII